MRIPTICPGSSDPFDIVTYYKKGSLLPGHTVCYKSKQGQTVYKNHWKIRQKTNTHLKLRLDLFFNTRERHLNWMRTSQN